MCSITKLGFIKVFHSIFSGCLKWIPPHEEKLQEYEWKQPHNHWSLIIDPRICQHFFSNRLILSKVRHLSKWREWNASLVGTWGAKQCPQALLFTLVLVETESLFSRESGHLYDCLNKIVNRSRKSDSASGDSKGTSNSSACLAFLLKYHFTLASSFLLTPFTQWEWSEWHRQIWHGSTGVLPAPQF